MPSRSTRTPRTGGGRGGAGSLLSPLRSASPLRRAPVGVGRVASFSRLDDDAVPSPAAPASNAAPKSTTNGSAAAVRASSAMVTEASSYAPGTTAAATASAASGVRTPQSQAQPSAQPVQRQLALSTASPHTSHMTMMSPYSGRPDPRRTLSPVDLDETPPATPSDYSSAHSMLSMGPSPGPSPANHGMSSDNRISQRSMLSPGGSHQPSPAFTPSSFDSFGFPSEEKEPKPSGANYANANDANGGDPFSPSSAASVGSFGSRNGATSNSNHGSSNNKKDRLAGYASPKMMMMVQQQTALTPQSSSQAQNQAPHIQSQKMSIAGVNVGGGANANDPFLDLTLDDDGFVTSGLTSMSNNAASTSTATTMNSNANTATAMSSTHNIKSPAPSGRPPAYRSPLPPLNPPPPPATESLNTLSANKRRPTTTTTTTNVARRTLSSHLQQQSAANNANANSNSIHRGVPSTPTGGNSYAGSVAGNSYAGSAAGGHSVTSTSSKHIGQLAVDSNCIAGEFHEIVVTLSEASTFEEEEDGYNTNHNNGGMQMRMIENGDGMGGNNGMMGGGMVDDVAFGLDPRDVSLLEDDDDAAAAPEEAEDDQYYQHLHRHHHHQQQRGHRGQQGHGHDQHGHHHEEEDYGPTIDRTPPRLQPHGIREGAEHMVVLSESQKKLREKILRNSASKAAAAASASGGGGGRANTNHGGIRLDEQFGSAAGGVGGGSGQREGGGGGRIPRPHDRSVLSPPTSGVPRNISTNNLGGGDDDDAANSPSSMISGVTNFTETGGAPPHVYRADGEEPPPEPSAQYRSSWMLPNGGGKGQYPQGYVPGSGVGPDYTQSYLDKPSGVAASPASVLADRRMAAAMRAASATPMSAQSARSSSSGPAPTQPDDDVMRSVANKVKTSMRMASPPPPAHPGLPRARSVSPKRPDSTNGVKLRHREYSDYPEGSAPPAAISGASAGGTGGSSPIVFGAPDTFGSEDSHGISIRDRAKALNDWMGGKGVAVEKEVRPTAGYTNDDMYQNSYLRRTSPQVVGSRKTIEGARASLTPPKTQLGPNSGTFAHGSAKSKSNGGSGSAARNSKNPPAFLASFNQGSDDNASPPPSPTINDNAMPSSSDHYHQKEVPTMPSAVSAMLNEQQEQGDSFSTQASASPASLKENSAPPPPPASASKFQQSSGNNADSDMAFLKSWSKSRGQKTQVQTPTSPDAHQTFPSPKFDAEDDGFGDVVSVKGSAVQGSNNSAWGMESTHADDEHWDQGVDDGFGEPF